MISSVRFEFPNYSITWLNGQLEPKYSSLSLFPKLTPELIKELGVETDDSKAPLEVGVWTLSTTASQRAEALSTLKSVPGVVSVQNKAVETVTPPAADISVLTEIRIQPIEK